MASWNNAPPLLQIAASQQGGSRGAQVWGVTKDYGLTSTYQETPGGPWSGWMAPPWVAGDDGVDEAGDGAAVWIEPEIQAGIGCDADALDGRIEVEAIAARRKIADEIHRSDRRRDTGWRRDDIERCCVGGRVDAEAIEKAVAWTKVDADQRFAGQYAGDEGYVRDTRAQRIEGDQKCAGQCIGVRHILFSLLAMRCEILLSKCRWRKRDAAPRRRIFYARSLVARRTVQVQRSAKEPAGRR